MGIKKGDTVKVLSGRDRKKTGKVLKIIGDKVWVEGLNMVNRHRKANQQNRQSSIVKKESPLRISKLAYYDVNTSKTSRIGYRLDDKGKRVRFAKRTNEVI